MKETIRQGVFETNSSSTHTLAIYNADDYDNNLYYYRNEIYTKLELEKIYNKEEFECLEDFLNKKLIEGDNIKWLYIDGKYKHYYDYYEDKLVLYKDFIKYVNDMDSYSYNDIEVNRFTTINGDKVVGVSIYTDN